MCPCFFPLYAWILPEILHCRIDMRPTGMQVAGWRSGRKPNMMWVGVFILMRSTEQCMCKRFWIKNWLLVKYKAALKESSETSF